MTIDEEVAEQIIAVGQNTPQVYKNGKRQGKSEGKAEGYTEGYVKGNTDGYESGYTDGETEGYGNGYAYGYENGYRDGGSDGYLAGKNDGIEQGIAEGIEQGKQAEYDAFWQSALGGSTLITSAIGRFAGGCWNDDTFKPPRPITIEGNCNYCFYSNGCTTLVGKIEKIVALQFSNAFQYSEIQHICTIDASNCTLLTSAFASRKIISIEKIISSADTPWHNTTFNVSGTLALEHAIFEGVIATSISIAKGVKLDKPSITSIINALSTTTTGLTVTVSKTAVDKAFETAAGANDGSTSAEWEALKNTRPNWGIGLA